MSAEDSSSEDFSETKRMLSDEASLVNNMNPLVANIPSAIQINVAPLTPIIQDQVNTRLTNTHKVFEPVFEVVAEFLLNKIILIF